MSTCEIASGPQASPETRPETDEGPPTRSDVAPYLHGRVFCACGTMVYQCQCDRCRPRPPGYLAVKVEPGLCDACPPSPSAPAEQEEDV